MSARTASVASTRSGSRLRRRMSPSLSASSPCRPRMRSIPTRICRRAAICRSPNSVPRRERETVSDEGVSRMHEALEKQSPAGTPFVHVRDASLHYGEDGEGVLALKDMCLDIGRGEFVAVVGPSGCGKSSLMKLISGLAPRSAGMGEVDGAEVTRPLKIVGMAFQNPALLPWRTVLENVLLPLQVVRPHRSDYRASKAPYFERARARLAKVGLAGV